MKNQIWSPEAISLAGGFELFGNQESGRSTTSFGEAFRKKGDACAFSMLPESIERLLNEPGVQARMQSVVQDKVNHALNEILQSYSWARERIGKIELSAINPQDFDGKLKKIEECLEGFWKQQLSELENRKRRLEAVLDESINEWKKERDSLLRVHEQEWFQTLVYILEKFQMKQKAPALESLKEWLKTVVEEFSAKAPVKVYLSSADYQDLQVQMRSESVSEWSFCEDKSLNSGQIRVEANNAGVVFDRERNCQKLFQILGVT